MALTEVKANEGGGDARLDRRKFVDPAVTISGEPRARIALRRLDTLWINTGTLCNLACKNCYIESSPTNDRLVFISAEEMSAQLDALERSGWDAIEIGFTGGEPFLNPDCTVMIEESLTRGHGVLVLTNAMRPMMKQAAGLLDLRARFGDRLVMRVSVDHYTAAVHEQERGPRSWQPTLDGLTWLARNGFAVRVAGRTFTHETDSDLRRGYGRLFASIDVAIDANDPSQLVLFPEMDERAEVPEITESCWSKVNVNPETIMCATSRMVVKRRGSDRPTIVPCTLLPYDLRFDLGPTLDGASGSVPLNHPHCARFCVLGGGSCSNTGDATCLAAE